MCCNEGELSSNRGPRGPIVVQENLLWKSRAVVPQDASLVETHMASRTPLPQGIGGIANGREFVLLYDFVCSIFDKAEG